MTEEEEKKARAAERDDRITRWIIITGWLLCVLAVLSIIVASVYLSVVTPAAVLPPLLKDSTQLCLGFLFGNMLGIIREFVINSFK